MAEGFTTAEATAILKERITPTTFVGLSSSTPTKTGSNFSEPAKSAGYTRAPFGEVDASIGAQIANSRIIFMFEATANCGSVTHVGLFKTEIAPTPFLVAQLTAPLSIGAGYVPLIRVHQLVIGLDKEELEPYGNT